MAAFESLRVYGSRERCRVGMGTGSGEACSSSSFSSVNRGLTLRLKMDSHLCLLLFPGPVLSNLSGSPPLKKRRREKPDWGKGFWAGFGSGSWAGSCWAFSFRLWVKMGLMVLFN